jgi:tRNA (cmo5U34)-methyltransferase
MTEASQTYRWNTSAAAEAYDEAAPTIHPFYETVQDQILNQLPFGASTPFAVVDLGGGSGRLLERVLARFEAARTILVDQSEPFLALAERRLTRFAPRVRIVRLRLQDDWAGALDEAPDVIVSTSAIHHLELAEKQSLFAQCYATLTPGGLFINGDEYRPASDAEFRALLEEWSNHMFAAIDAGQIGESFRATVEQWHDRNIKRFGGPKKSGDDCLETAATQLQYLEQAGFTACKIVWAEKLWGVAIGHK